MTKAEDFRVMVFGSLERRLQMLRVAEMLFESRPHFHEQGFELGVVRIRDECGVERSDHLFVISHLVVDVGAVERGAVERAEVGEIGLSAGLQRPAGVVGFGCHAEPSDEFNRALVHGGVIGHHHGGELFDGGILSLRGGQVAGVDVDLVGGDDNGRNLSVGRLGAEPERQSDKGGNEGEALRDIHGEDRSWFCFLS